MHSYLRHARARRQQVIDTIRAFVECESPSHVPAEVNRFVDLLAAKTRDIAAVRRFGASGVGDHLRLEFKLPGRKKQGQILAVGHSDTVWPLGTLAGMPFRLSKGRLWGPGVLDMKSGLAFLVEAVRLLRELQVEVKRKIVLLVVSDEEIGSKTSRAITESEARNSDMVLVLEPGTGLEGKLKTARKGVGRYTLAVEGRAAHAGVDFERGASAIVEAARQIERIAALTDLARGITVNPGVMNGGTASNVVAAQAQVEIDVRIQNIRDAARVDKKLRALKPIDRRCTLQVGGGLNRPPMERTPAIAKLFGRAAEIARELDLDLGESSTGGGSDGNFTAALGVPTLDGLGGVGEGAHAAHESILLDRIPERVALLAALLADL